MVGWKGPSMSVELWKTIFDWATVVLIAFTVGSGAGALITGDIIAKRREAKLHQFEMDIEKQKDETAKSQAEVLRLQKQRLPRTLEFDSNDSLQELIASLKRTPLTAEILYKNGDGEASWLAEQIRGLLLSAQWIVPRPAPIPESVAANAVEQLKAGVDGVTLITKQSSEHDKPGSAETLLGNLLVKSLGSIARSWDESLPDNFIRIIILQKP